MKFNRLGSATNPDILFDTYISEDGQLRIEGCLLNCTLTDNWILLPNSNKQEIVNKFCKIYSNKDRITGKLEYCIEQAQLFYKDNTEHNHPIHLICNHCKQIVQTGIFNVSEHSFTCPIYTGYEVEDGIIAIQRPTPSFTAIYKIK